MTKRLLSCLLILVLVLSIVPTALAADTDPADGYNDHDFSKIQTFLDLPSATDGKTNAQCLGYDPANPTTWKRVTWSTDDEKRVKDIDFIYRETGDRLSGSLDISGFTALEKIECSDNELTSLNVSDCTALKLISCSNNKLNSLNISGCTALEQISCTHNALTSLNVSDCTALTGISCSNNKLSSLDVSGRTEMTYLYCDYNALKTLDVSGLIKLVYFECEGNELTSLDVSDKTDLNMVYCFDNKLTYINVSGCTSLDELDCSDNKLTSLDVSDLATLRMLSCNNNMLTSIDESTLPPLQILECGSNPLESLNISGMTSLTCLDCSNTGRTSLDVSTLTGLSELDCANNSLTLLDVSALTAMNELNCSNNSLKLLDISALKWLQELNCSGNALTSLDASLTKEQPDNALASSNTSLTRAIKPNSTLASPESLTGMGSGLYIRTVGNPLTQTNVDIDGNDINLAAAGSGYVEIDGESHQLIAKPKSSAHFINWTAEDGSQVATSEAIAFDYNTPYNLTANFADPVPVGISCTKTDATVYGGTDGSVTITASGGDSGSYEYSINGGENWQATAYFGGLAAGTYTAAVRDADNKTNTATKSITVGQPANVPGQVKNIKATAYPCAVYLTWDPVEGATSYEIPGMDPIITEDTSLWIHGFYPKSSFEFQIIACNSNGEGIPSDTMTVDTLSFKNDPPYPSKVTDLKVLGARSDDVYTSVRIEFGQVTDAMEYIMKLSTNPDMSNSRKQRVFSSTGPVYDFESDIFAPETTYYMQILTDNFDADDNHWYTPSDIVTFTTPAPKYPIPKETTAELRNEFYEYGSNWVTLAWSLLNGASGTEWGNVSGFRLYYSKSYAVLNEDSCPYIDIPVSAWILETYKLKGLDPSTTYYYKVLPYNSLGFGTPTEVASIITKAPANITTQEGKEISISDTDSGVSLTFSNVTGSGDTTIATLTSEPSGANFYLSESCGYYNIETKAVFSGPVTITLPYDPSKISVPESDLRLYQFKDGTPIDITKSVDTDNNTITGVVTDHFCAFAVGTPASYTVSASPNNAAYGAITGGGMYNHGDTATLHAIPNTGYRFVRWTENSVTVSQNPSYAFTATGSRTLTAEFAALTPVGISCSKTDVTLYGSPNGTVTITASGGDSGSYEYSINGGTNWQSTGYFDGLPAGTYATVVCDAIYKNLNTCSVTIGQPSFIGSYSASKIPAKVNAGNALTIIPPAVPKGYTVTSVTYTSSNLSTAAVDSKGNVTFLAGGKATITTKVVSQMTDSKGKVKTKTTTIKKTVTVNQPVSSITLSLSDTTISRSKKVKLTATISPCTASNKKVAWKSSNSKVAAVSSSGVVTGKAAGTAIITCTAKDGSGVSVSCILTVTPI